MEVPSLNVNPHSPVRVASLQPSVTVTLERLGLLPRLVACTRYCAEVVPSVTSSGIRIIRDSWTASCDEIVAAQPNIVITSVPYQLESVAQILKAGIRFVGLAPKCLNDIYGDIATIASLMGVAERGEALIREMKDEIHWAQDLTRGLGPQPRVFAEEWGKPIIHSQPWVAELVEAAGGEFIGQPGARTDAKAVAAENPDVILAAWCGAGNRVPLKKIVRDRGWADTNAVRNQRVYCISDELLNTPGPTLTRGLHAILRALHPDHFPASAGVRHITDEL